MLQQSSLHTHQTGVSFGLRKHSKGWICQVKRCVYLDDDIYHQTTLQEEKLNIQWSAKRLQGGKPRLHFLVGSRVWPRGPAQEQFPWAAGCGEGACQDPRPPELSAIAGRMGTPLWPLGHTVTCAVWRGVGRTTSRVTQWDVNYITVMWLSVGETKKCYRAAFGGSTGPDTSLILPKASSWAPGQFLPSWDNSSGLCVCIVLSFLFCFQLKLSFNCRKYP